jgi:7-keto-8-aminopelargonate synthetase-like enzyme
MAQIKHNHFIDTVDEMLATAKKEGTIHLYAEDKIFTGRTLQINGTALFHFATTSYLGLEYDNRLKAAAISAIAKYGTHFPLSKTYLSHPLYLHLNDAMEQLEGQIASAKIAMARLSSPSCIMYYPEMTLH